MPAAAFCAAAMPGTAISASVDTPSANREAKRRLKPPIVIPSVIDAVPTSLLITFTLLILANYVNPGRQAGATW